jgi:hypothetical protein
MAARVRLFLDKMQKIPSCTVCGNPTNYHRVEHRFMKTCSTKCAAADPIRIEKIKETSIAKFGHVNYLGSIVHKEKMKKLNQNKFGVDWYFSSAEFKKKSKETCQLKYGVNYHVQSQQSIENIRKTNIEKYGNPVWFQSVVGKEQTRQSLLERYGVEHQMQIPEILDKQMKSAHRKRDYFFPSGKRISIQGYENLALDVLLKTYREEDIFAGNEVFPEIGAIEYVYKGKKKRYFPDIYVKSKNLLIDVKSDWTLRLHYDLNIAKREACKASRFEFQFWVFGKTGFEVLEF